MKIIFTSITKKRIFVDEYEGAVEEKRILHGTTGTRR